MNLRFNLIKTDFGVVSRQCYLPFSSALVNYITTPSLQQLLDVTMPIYRRHIYKSKDESLVTIRKSKQNVKITNILCDAFRFRFVEEK